ncbi:MAG: TonB-dependent receptor domain-containing protein, partial [Gammaproteobacteria bacterium]
AEMPTPGVLSQFISKSGGNAYHGRVYADYQNEGIQARNIDNSLVALCPSGRLSGCGNLTPSDLNRITGYHDINADIGGYLKKDKLWWYFSGRDQNIKSLLPNFPVKPFETGLRNLSGKVTYALTQNNKLVGYAGGGRKTQPNRLDTFRVAATVARHESEESTWEQLYWGHTYKGEWSSVVSDSVFFETRVGQFKYEWPNYRYTEAPAYQDIASNLVSGGNRDGWFNIPERNQWHGSLTYFNDRLAGSHNFKFGGEVLHETFTYIRGEGVNGVVPGDVIHYLNNGNPQEVDLFQTPSMSENGLWTISAYVQDTWRVTNRLTLNLGVRYDLDLGVLGEDIEFLPWLSGSRPYDGNNVAPRLGFAFGLNDRTVIRGGYGLFYTQLESDAAHQSE